MEAIGPIAFCLDFDNNFSIGMQHGEEEAVEIRLHSVLELISGQRVFPNKVILSPMLYYGSHGSGSPERSRFYFLYLPASGID